MSTYDIPQEVRDAAERVVEAAAAEVARLLRSSDEVPDDIPDDGVFEPLIARAIMAAKAEAITKWATENSPVAWRVKDFADGWILYETEEGARSDAKRMADAFVQPLYALSNSERTDG